MEALSELISHKLKFIAHFQDNVDIQDSQMMDILLKEKKKESINEMVQSRLVQNLLTTRIKAPYSIEQFFHKSLHLMKLSDPDFELPSEIQNHQIYAKIIETYITFFTFHNCHIRAQEIAHIYNKKLCDKSLLLPTLFNWFNEWTRKKFSAFLKTELVKQGINRRRQQSTMLRQKSPILMRGPLHSEIQSPKTIIIKSPDSIKATGPLIDRLPQEAPENDIIHPYRSMALQQKYQRNQSQKQIEILTRKSIDSEQSRIIRKKAINSWPVDENLIVNRQTFIGAFNEECQNYYSTLVGIIADLDYNYVKGVRKNDRKEEYKVKLKQIAGVLAKGQIKKSIAQYSQQYKQRFYTIKKSKSKQKPSNEHLKKRIIPTKKFSLDQSASIQQDQQNPQQTQERQFLESKSLNIIDNSFIFQNSSNKSLTSKYKTIEKQIICQQSVQIKPHRTIELKLPVLPQVNTKEVENKILLSKRIKYRYPNAVNVYNNINKIKNLSQEMSAEVKNEIISMNKLFKIEKNPKIKNPKEKKARNISPPSPENSQKFIKHNLDLRDKKIIMDEFNAIGRRSLDSRSSKHHIDLDTLNHETPQRKSSGISQKNYKGIFYFPKLSK